MNSSSTTIDQAHELPLVALELSNRFGGDGRTSFRLPDMRARDAAGHPLPFVVRSWGEPEPPGPHWPGWVICVAGVFPRRSG